jgi:hypothetical protein
LKLMKRHLNPATVIACIALFAALGGAAVAAKTASKVKTQNLVNGAVTTAKIRNGAVTTGKLRNGAVTGQKIASATIGSGQLANGSVRSGQLGGQVVTEPKIKNGAVTESKLGTGAVSSGKLAPTFLAQLLRNVTYVTETSENDSETEKFVTAKCPSGKEVIGGGARINSSAKVAVAVNASYPLVDSNNGRIGWIAGGRETPEEKENWQVVAYAICAEL